MTQEFARPKPQVCSRNGYSLWQVSDVLPWKEYRVGEYIFRSYFLVMYTPNSRDSCCLWKGFPASEIVLSTGYIF